MKKFILAIPVLAALALSSCNKVDQAIYDRLDNLGNRITALESQAQSINSDITTLQGIIAALQANLTVSSVVSNKDGGFTIKFSDGSSYTIINGKDGVDGKDGADGKSAPTIGVKQDTDGLWYWTLDGSFLTVDGAKVLARGKDGADGITPQLKVEEGWWYITYDGATWTQLAEASSSSSTPSIVVEQDDDHVYIKQSDGTVITLPKASEFAFVAEQTAFELLTSDLLEIPYTITKGDTTVVLEVWKEDNYHAEIVPANDGCSGIIKVTVPDPIVEGSIMILAIKNSTSEMLAQTFTFKKGLPSTVTWEWDFSTAGWQAIMSPMGDPGVNYEGWNLSLDGLKYTSTASSRWNTTYIQAGGAGSKTNRVFEFDAPKPGVLKVWATNTGGTEDMSRCICVQVDEGEVQKIPAGSAAGTLTECKFNIEAGHVYIYPSAALRIYKILYTNEAPKEVTLTWDFTASYSADINVADANDYLYNPADGTATLAETITDDNLYLSPNSKSVKTNKKTCTADGITYRPLGYGGGASYMYLQTSRAGTLKVTAVTGKDQASFSDCKLGIKIGDTAVEPNVDLTYFDLAVAGMNAQTYEWDIPNEAGSSQKISIVKPSGSNSPWIFKVEFVYTE